MAGARLGEGGPADDLAAADQGDEQRPVVAVVVRRLADADHLGLGGAVGVAAAQGVLATADRDLVRGYFFATDTISPLVALAGDQLVDEAARRVARAGDQLGADAVARRPARPRSAAIAYSSRSLVTMMRVPGRAEGVELRAHLAGDARRGRRSRAVPRRARGRPPRRRAAPPRRRRRCRPAASVPLPRSLHLGPERVVLGVVQQGEGVRAGARGRDAVPLAGPRGWRWPRSRRRTPRGRPPPPPARGCGASPSRCRAARRPRRSSGTRPRRSRSRGCRSRAAPSRAARPRRRCPRRSAAGSRGSRPRPRRSPRCRREKR